MGPPYATWQVLADVLLKALHPDPVGRFRDIDAMERALHDCAAASGELFYHVYLSYTSESSTEAALARKVTRGPIGTLPDPTGPT